MSKAKLFPSYGAGRYNDIYMKCPFCHKPIIIFAGFGLYHRCCKCGARIKDKVTKENNAAYKYKKHMNKPID